MDRNFDDEIEQQLGLLKPIEHLMEENKEAFIQEVVSYFRPWFWEQTEGLAKGNPEVTRELGKEGLGKLKSDVKALQDNTEKIVRQYLDIDSLWWHLKQNRLNAIGTSEYWSSTTSGVDYMPSTFDDAFGSIGGALGVILEKYGYISSRGASRSTSSYKPVWNKTLEGGYHGPPYKNPLNNTTWPGGMKPPIKQYQDLYQQAGRIIQELNKLKREKERSEAHDLWDNA